MRDIEYFLGTDIDGKMNKIKMILLISFKGNPL